MNALDETHDSQDEGIIDARPKESNTGGNSKAQPHQSVEEGHNTANQNHDTDGLHLTWSLAAASAAFRGPRLVIVVVVLVARAAFRGPRLVVVIVVGGRSGTARRTFRHWGGSARCFLLGTVWGREGVRASGTFDSRPNKLSGHAQGTLTGRARNGGTHKDASSKGDSLLVC